ncbi:hypothetical protein K456DRAFT_600843 [Colletotrichum gloeosporioides 23]|nr:hypothetical protein K456DRAFT_600843 [Colletotrichum gloeosporioides 23]
MPGLRKMPRHPGWFAPSVLDQVIPTVGLSLLSLAPCPLSLLAESENVQQRLRRMPVISAALSSIRAEEAVTSRFGGYDLHSSSTLRHPTANKPGLSFVFCIALSLVSCLMELASTEPYEKTTRRHRTMEKGKHQRDGA